MFKDKFCKWPKLLRSLIFISLLPPFVTMLFVYNQLAPLHLLYDILTLIGAFNLLMLFWGLILKIRAKKYWYRNYHIGKTMLLALIPVVACGYLLATERPDPRVAQQVEIQSVEITTN
ncbi:hypothetical protein C9I89_16570 [Photobacterium lipolyticum]|uniref:Uncharacterized protein n=1 Tax=Photobacterium lipolyticum TaxID=266810 RepID=A0A2T3MVA3_9GAMM|nr:hypothetical protein C9I89_16570 [Photobacterium lipolyticum]